MVRLAAVGKTKAALGPQAEVGCLRKRLAHTGVWLYTGTTERLHVGNLSTLQARVCEPPH